MLKIGTDARVQVVNDDARAQGVYRARRAWGQDVWQAEKDKERANMVEPGDEPPMFESIPQQHTVAMTQADETVPHAQYLDQMIDVPFETQLNDILSEVRDVQSELLHVRELVDVLVRRERCVEDKAEVAARRLTRTEREKDDVDDAEHEADLQEALTNKAKVARLVVDKWFVDKGYGFGITAAGEIVFIHSSVVQGAEVLMVGTDAWAQVVSDHARAEERYRARKAWGRNAWRQERDKEKANRVAQQVRRAAALTAELAVQSEKNTAAVCDQPQGLDELAEHIEAPNMEAGGSHQRPQ